MNENKERFLIRFLNDKYFIRLYKKMGKEERREITVDHKLSNEP